MDELGLGDHGRTADAPAFGGGHRPGVRGAFKGVGGVPSGRIAPADPLTAGRGKDAARQTADGLPLYRPDRLGRLAIYRTGKSPCRGRSGPGPLTYSDHVPVMVGPDRAEGAAATMDRLGRALYFAARPYRADSKPSGAHTEQSEQCLERPAAVTQRSSACYRHWPFRCCSSPASRKGIVIRTESEPFQRRRSSRPIGVRGTPVMDTALDEKKESRPSRTCSSPSGSSVTPAACSHRHYRPSASVR